MSALQLHRVLGRLDLVGIDQPILPPHLIHRLHNHQTLLVRHALTLQPPVAQTPPTLIRLPEHAMPRNLTLVLLDIRALLLGPLSTRIRPALRPVLADDAVVCGAEGGPVDLDLAFGALDADGGFGGVVAVDVGGDAEVGQRDAVRWVGAGAAGAAGEGQDDGGVFVGAGGGVFGDGGGDGGGLARGGGDGVVQGLETPGYGIDAHWGRYQCEGVLGGTGGWRARTVEESTAGQVHVDHAVLGAPGVLNVLAKAQVGNDAVDGAQLAVFDVLPDLFA